MLLVDTVCTASVRLWPERRAESSQQVALGADGHSGSCFGRPIRTGCVAGCHRSRTSRDDRDRDTQIIMVSHAARSSSVSSESRCSGSPSSTAVSHVPHVPSRQDESTATPASSSVSRIERSDVTVSVRPDDARLISKVVRGPVSCTGVNRSTCRDPAEERTLSLPQVRTGIGGSRLGRWGFASERAATRTDARVIETFAAGVPPRRWRSHPGRRCRVRRAPSIRARRVLRRARGATSALAHPTHPIRGREGSAGGAM